MSTMTDKRNAQEKKDFDKFTKFLVHKSIQIIVQSRLGEKIKTRSKPFSSGADWFNLAITDNNEVHSEAKRVLSGQSTTLGQSVCVEISLRTTDGDTMVLEMWSLSLDTSHADMEANVSYTVYNRMSVVLKSLLTVSRVTPAYKLSRRQSSCASDYIICYRIYLGDPQLLFLGERYQRSKVGSVSTPYGTISINLAYRTKLLISPQKTWKETPFEVKDDHFKQDNTSPKRPTTPKPCSLAYTRQSTGESDTGHSEESCSTTFSVSPTDAVNNRITNPAHHQSQPIKINAEHTCPEAEPLQDRLRPQSAPEKQATFPERRAGAFAKHLSKDKLVEVDDVPFLSLLEQPRLDKKLKPDKLDVSKGTSSTKTDSSKMDTSDSACSESKTSVSSQASAPDDFVMVELKTPFAGADANSDLGKFYRDCQGAPSLTMFEEDITAGDTLEHLTSQLDIFENNMNDFDTFVSTISTDSPDTSFSEKVEFDIKPS